MKTARPLIVVSAVNIFNAGPLSIMQDFLRALVAWNREGGRSNRIVAFVHDVALYPGYTAEDVELIAVPRSRRSYLFRLFYEYVYFYFWSRRRDVHTWISMHDVTPNVVAQHRIVYCHHATPFYTGPPSRLSRESFFAFQRRIYSFFYRFNLRKNDFVIVQQQWLRNAFVQRFGLDASRIIVSRPSIVIDTKPAPRRSSETILLFYPSFPRFFKNFEAVVDALSLLSDLPFQLVLTFRGDENPYARAVRDRARLLPNVEFRGFVSRSDVFQLYADCDAMVFASRLESFGLPLVEVQSFRKPVFAADLPYAHEALDGYESVAFFDPDDHRALADLLRCFADRRVVSSPRPSAVVPEPFAVSWAGLMSLLESKRSLPTRSQATHTAE